jgi:N-acetylglucosamine-6-phosphate deacetylase
MKFRGLTLEHKAVELQVENGYIVKRQAIPAEPTMPRLLPCLVDLQHNGALGYSYNNLTLETGEQELETISAHLLKNGVGRVLATFTTADYSILNTGANALNKILSNNKKLDTLFCGIFHEGVFISPEYGWRGGHQPQFIRKPDWEIFSHLNEKSGNRIKMVKPIMQNKEARADEVMCDCKNVRKHGKYRNDTEGWHCNGK